MQKLVFFAFVLALACTKHNPEACCATPDQCSMYGLGGITPCEGTGQVCDTTGTCVMPQCTTSTDCTDPTMPFCENQFCVAACGSDGDCMAMAGKPFCAPSGACEACLDNSACSMADAPVCDGSAHACRGCVADSECASGICLESNGTCADESQTVFVDILGHDTGTCTKASPCHSMEYAFGQMSGARNVLKVIPTMWSEPATIQIQNVNGYIDGSTTTMSGNGSDGLFTMLSGNVTITGFTFTPSVGIPVVDARQGQITFYGDTLTGNININGGMAVLQHAAAVGVACGDVGGPVTVPGGTIEVERSTLSGISTNHCAVTVKQSTFDDTSTNGDPIRLGSATQPFTIENNVFVSTDAFTDAVSMAGPSGSVFRFNTLVNLSGMDQTAQPLECLGDPIEVSNNIVAWHTSTAPHCSLTYTLVDSIEALPPGTGNLVGDASTFFVDMANKNFHLAPGSPAIGAAEPGVNVTVDHDGNPRPQPAGTNADVGAFEAP